MNLKVSDLDRHVERAIDDTNFGTRSRGHTFCGVIIINVIIIVNFFTSPALVDGWLASATASLRLTS